MDGKSGPSRTMDQVWKPVKRVTGSALGAFGPGTFGQRAEAFAKGFGTPGFLLAQTIVVAGWIIANGIILEDGWDPYPFILLNLMFSLQAAYAAPLILLAQTRQADRDRLLYEAETDERESIANAAFASQQEGLALLHQLVERVEANTEALHALGGAPEPGPADA